jgi:CRISPR system Cascade subunit CasA
LTWPDDQPWRLVVDDVTKPAFMQPPVPPSSGDPHRTPIHTADDLDVLETARNHGVKQGIGSDAVPAAWIAALVLLQTCASYSKAGPQFYYGTVRRYGQYATRPSVSLVPWESLAAHWRRDVAVLLRHREWFFDRVEDFAGEEGAALLWCLPWDGERSLGLDELDPWFIEVCRRVRLYRDHAGKITAKSVGSSVPRVTVAKERRGNLGDPWTPIDLSKESAAYNRTPRYDVMTEVLFNRGLWLRPLLLDWHKGIDGSRMIARFDVTVRGQSKTEGHHLREVPIQGEKRLVLFQSDAERDRLAKISKDMIEEAATLRNKVLKIPLLTLIQAGDATVDFRDKMANAWAQPWLDQVDQAIEPVFFDHLFARAEQGPAADKAWVAFLRTIVDRIFARAASAVPIAGARRLKAIAVAEEKLGGLFFASFKGYLVQPTEETADVG